MSAERDWDAATYDRVSDPQYRWALEQLEQAGEPLVLEYLRLNMTAGRPS